MECPTFETLLLDLDGDTLTVTINRPKRANAVNRQLLHDLIGLTDWLATTPDIHFVILTNTGRVFSAGHDLTELRAEMADPQLARSNSRSVQILAQEMMRKLESLEQIMFVGMRGSAYGAGMAIALTADFRVMSDTSIGNLPEVRLGMFLTYGSLPRLVQLIGLSKAKQFVMFAEDATAQQLHELGAVDHVLPDERVLEFITEKIQRLRVMDYRALRITKRVANAAAAAQFGDIMHIEPDLVEGSLADDTLVQRLDEYFS